MLRCTATLCFRLACFLVPLAACESGDTIPAGPVTSVGTGPRVVWDLGAQPLPEIPLPNDIATVRDERSPTGIRINASLIASTALESAFRTEFDELDGWGTYQPITVSFDQDLDLGNVLRRHRGDDFAFPNDAVYLVDLETGLPVPLDLGEGNFPFTRRDQSALFPNDPRAGESNIVLETVNEDSNHDGMLQPSEDTNFDGVLGRASVYPAGGNAFDNLTGFYEASTRTLIVRPLLPLRENHRYAVVLTDRLVGLDGQPVRSAFAGIAHPSQLADLDQLDAFLRARPDLYGSLRWRRSASDSAEAAHVALAWRYTTQFTTSEWFAVRDGLYGRGPFRALQAITPRESIQDITFGGSACTADERAHPFVVGPAQLDAIFQALWSLDSAGSDAVHQAQRDSFRNVAYLVAGSYHAPFLLNTDPLHNIDPHAHWQVNLRTGETPHVGDAQIPFILVVPKISADHPQPFPLAFYLHGYGAGVTEVMTSAGLLASNGVASIAIDGPTHGIPAVASLVSAIRTFLRGSCALGVGELLLGLNRARDLDGNGIQDPAGDFWTGYVVHSRDNVRQYALEISQLVRTVRGWDGRAIAGVDLNHDGNLANDLAGDFDGNGVPDVGASSRLYVMGESLGGIMSQLLGGAEPEIRAAVPFSGGGGLSDIAVRSSQGGIKEAVYLRLMGPLVVGVPASQYTTQTHGPCSSSAACDFGSTCAMDVCTTTRTACQPNQISIRMLETDVTEVGELEIACATVAGEPANPTSPPGPGWTAAIQPGDDVLVVNRRNGVVRCARADAAGLFRVGIPSDVGDRETVQIFRGPVVQNFGTCELSPTAQLRSQIDEFRVAEGDCSLGCGHIPRTSLRDTDRVNGAPFVATYFRATAAGQPLVSPAEGLGLRRQSPEFRRFLTLAQAMLDKGDPINFASQYYFHTPPADNTQPERHAVIVCNTVGDQNVPLNTGNAFSRAAGIIPFLSASAPAHLRDFATPDALALRWGRTPNRVLIDDYVLEGIHWLNRWPVAGRPDALMDVDNLDEGADRFGERELSPPLRLVRLARSISADAADDVAVWGPTLQAAWTPQPDQPLAATLNYYVAPQGHHSVDQPPRPDLAFDYTTYMYNLVGRFFASDGTDIYYRSHPDTHGCLARSLCPPP